MEREVSHILIAPNELPDIDVKAYSRKKVMPKQNMNSNTLVTD